jgi:NADH-quinone oxidoreductase subunit H
MQFAMFFLAEYAHIIFMSLLTALLFFGGWLPPFDCFPFNLIPGEIWLGLKTILFMFVFVWVRASFPRFRMDTLMMLLWKSYLPLSLGFLLLTASILISFNGLPL